MFPKLTNNPIQEEKNPPDKHKTIKKEGIAPPIKKQKDYMRDYLKPEEIEQIIQNKSIKIEYEE